jgi:hypothetical protein
MLDGDKRKLWGFTFTLCYSRAMMAEAATNQKVGTVLRMRGIVEVEAGLENLPERSSTAEPSYAEFLDQAVSCELDVRRTIQAGFRAYFITAHDLVTDLAELTGKGGWNSRLAVILTSITRLIRTDVTRSSPLVHTYSYRDQNSDAHHRSPLPGSDRRAVEDPVHRLQISEGQLQCDHARHTCEQ